MGKNDKTEAALEAQRAVMHRTGHAAFTHQQSEVLKQLYKTEARTHNAARKKDDEPEDANGEKHKIQFPVSEEEVAILRNGTSREGKGRALYLEGQHKKPPRERFVAPVTSAQQYGWDHDLATFSSTAHSRKAVLKHTCERTRGVFNPDLI